MQFDIKKKKNFNYKIVNAIIFDQLMKVLKRKFEFRNERWIQEVIIRWWWSPNIRYILKARFPYRFDDRGTYMSANKTYILNKKMFYFFLFPKLNWFANNASSKPYCQDCLFFSKKNDACSFRYKDLIFPRYLHLAIIYEIMCINFHNKYCTKDSFPTFFD